MARIRSVPPSSPASAANRVRATESPFTETINDFCNKICQKSTKRPHVSASLLRQPCQFQTFRKPLPDVVANEAQTNPQARHGRLRIEVAKPLHRLGSLVVLTQHGVACSNHPERRCIAWIGQQ